MTAPNSPHFRRLEVGEPAPWFAQRSESNPRYVFDTAAGRYIVLCFFGSAAAEPGRAALAFVQAHRSLFDDDTMAFFGVSNDPADEAQGRLAQSLPGVRYLWDFDGSVSRLYGAIPDEPMSGQTTLRPVWFVLDPTLRVIAAFPFNEADPAHGALSAFLRALPPPDRFAGPELQAPVLFLPNVFEPELCRTLIALYDAQGGTPSGFMREVDSRTVLVSDAAHKIRSDVVIEDTQLMSVLQRRVLRRIVPEMRKAFQFEATRLERYIVACYRAEDGGHFRQHRDNTTKGTAHRRFAVSINLNSDFDGGDLNFPEYGPRSFKPPPGAAVVFSCSLLHRVAPMTRGARYAFLPFLYDDAAAKIREANNAFLGEGVGLYSERSEA